MNELSNFSLEDEIDIKKLFFLIFDKKVLIASITSGFAIIAIIYSLMIPNQYQSTIIVAPIENNANKMSGALSSSALGGIASMAGIDISGEGVSEYKIAIQVMQSWGFIEQFISKNQLESYLVTVTGWDSKENKLIYDDSLYDPKNKKWLVPIPTSWALYKAFKNRLMIGEDPKTGMTTVSFKYFSPSHARDFLQLYIQDINDFMKLRKLETVDKSIDYLQEQINKTMISDMENVFYQIIAEQTKTKMLAEAMPEYTFVTISKAMIPEEKSEPTRSLIVIISTILGFILSTSAAIVISLREGNSLKPDIDKY